MKLSISSIFQYAVLAWIALILALLLIFVQAGNRAVSLLSAKTTYLVLAEKVDISKTVRTKAEEAVAVISKWIPGDTGPQTKPIKPIQDILDAIESASQAAVGRLSAQVADYVAGHRETLDGYVDLTEVRRVAIRTAQESLPGGRFFRNQIASAVTAVVPETVSLRSQTDQIKALLNPLRTLVVGIKAKLPAARLGIIACLILTVLVGFELARGTRWVGLGFLLAGAIGMGLTRFSEGISAVFLKDNATTNSMIKELIVSSLEGLSNDGAIWLGMGAAIFVLALVIPFALKSTLKKKKLGSIGSLASRLCNRNGRVTFVTAIALVPAFISAGIIPRLKRGGVDAEASALGSMAMAGTLLDYALPLLLFYSVITVGSMLTSDGGSVQIAMVCLGVGLAVFWIFRDLPGASVGFNIIDLMAGIGREPVSEPAAKFSRCYRSLPLLATLLLSFFVPPLLAFGAVCTVEIGVLVAQWPHRTLGDVLAKTRVVFRGIYNTGY
ncbi:MAG: hypothetical protein QNJ97_15405 [Myxococcota bacterium]|nr:hypothetical protein [Myxococcota bacterium]